MTTFLKPSSILRELPQKRYSTTLDIGAGTGALSSLLVHQSDRVVSLDIHPSALSSLSRLSRSHSNLAVMCADIEREEGIPLRSNTVDLVVLCNVLFQLENKEHCMREVKRVLSPHGCAMIIDWEDSFEGIGPHRDHVTPSHHTLGLIEDSGMNMIRRLSLDQTPYHYGFLVTK